MQLDPEILFQNMFNTLKSYYAGFCTGLQEAIRQHCEIQSYHKNSTIPEYGQVCKSCFFALQGLVVARFMHDGNEKVSWFMGSGDVIIAVDSFYRQTPSTEKLVASMDVICISLPNEANQWNGTNG